MTLDMDGNIDQGSWYLTKIAELGSESSPFSITLQDNYYAIRVGDSSYLAQHLGLEYLMNAYVCLLADKRKKENW